MTVDWGLVLFVLGSVIGVFAVGWLCGQLAEKP